MNTCVRSRPADSVDACVSKAMRLKVGVAMALKNAGGKHRTYKIKKYDEIGLDVDGVADSDGKAGGSATSSDERKEGEKKKEEL